MADTAKKPRLRANHFKPKKTSGRASPICRNVAKGGWNAERALGKIRSVLQKHKGRIDLAAGELKVSSRTLSRWLNEHGLQAFASGLRAKHEIPGPRPTGT